MGRGGGGRRWSDGVGVTGGSAVAAGGGRWCAPAEEDRGARGLG